MKKIIAASFLTLDGFMASSDGKTDWVMETFNHEMAAELVSQQSTTDTILLGRITYELFANWWPDLTNSQNPSADHMNQSKKIVLSRSLVNAPWGKWNNAFIIRDNVFEEIIKLKEMEGKDILIIGSASVIQGLTELRLIDEYKLFIHPILLGNGIPLFTRASSRINLVTTNVKLLSNGVSLHHFRNDKKSML